MQTFQVHFTQNTLKCLHLKCTKTADFQLKIWHYLWIFSKKSSLKDIIWNAPERIAFQLEMHERPLRGLVILWLMNICCIRDIAVFSNQIHFFRISGFTNMMNVFTAAVSPPDPRTVCKLKFKRQISRRITGSGVTRAPCGFINNRSGLQPSCI